MKVLVLWANEHHPNLGVAALGQGTSALAKQAFGPNTDVRFHGTGSEQLPFNDGPLNISRVKLILKAALTPGSEFRRWVTSFDLIIDARGGDSFADIYGVKRQIKTSVLSWIAPLLGVPVVLGPQTIGPFMTLPGKVLGSLTLRMASRVITRDPISTEYARKLGRTPETTATDVVFALPTSDLKKNYDVLLNVSGLLWDPNPHVDHRVYRETIHEIIRGLQAAGRTVTLLPHVLSDNPAARGDNDLYPLAELAREFPGLESAVPKGLSHVRELVGSANLVIAARMHACLNAISMGTPAIPMAYSRKFDPLLAQIQWEHTVDIRTGDQHAEAVLQRAAARDELNAQVRQIKAHADTLVEKAASALRDSARS